MSDYKEALDAAEKFQLRANAARIKKAALDAVASHEKQAAPPFDEDTPENEHEAEQPEAPAPEPVSEPEPTEVERTEPATDPAPLPVPPVEPPVAEAVPEPPPVEIPEEDEEETPESEEVMVRTMVEAEIDDPQTVKAVMEFLKEEDLIDSSIEVKEGVWGWREAANFATISFGTHEYMVAPNEEAARQFALAMVKDQLKDEPELFTQSWVEGFIDKEKLRDALKSDVEDMVIESPKSYGWEPEVIDEKDDDEEDDDIAEDEPLTEDEPSEDWVEDKVEELLKDPIQYLEDIYGKQDAMKEAMRIAGINIDEAAEDAIKTDGPAHFLSSYDGNMHDLPSGGVYWRHN